MTLYELFNKGRLLPNTELEALLLKHYMCEGSILPQKHAALYVLQQKRPNTNNTLRAE